MFKLLGDLLFLCKCFVKAKIEIYFYFIHIENFFAVVVEVNIDRSNKFTKSLRKKEDKRDYLLVRTYAAVVKNDL